MALDLSDNPIANLRWVCAKCDSPHFSVAQLRGVGGFFTKLFDVQSRKFKTVSCKSCGYTELYKKTSSATGDVVDFLFGG